MSHTGRTICADNKQTIRGNQNRLHYAKCMAIIATCSGILSVKTSTTVAQLVRHHLDMVGVGGSSPLGCTNSLSQYFPNIDKQTGYILELTFFSICSIILEK